MKKLTLDIKPKEGLGELSFGMTSEQVYDLLGEPDEREILDDEVEIETLILHYDEPDISLFFEGESDKKVLVNIETDNRNALMWGNAVFAMKRPDIIALMKGKGYMEMDTEVHEDKLEYPEENRVSFDEAMMDFFFEDDILTAVSWGDLPPDML